MYCQRCGAELRGTTCPDCGKSNTTKKVNFDFSAPAICCICNNNKGLGKKFKIGIEPRTKEVCYCFKCSHAESMRDTENKPMTFDTKEEAQYNHALVSDYLEPLFYDKEPNWKVLETLARKMNDVQIKADRKKDFTKKKITLPGFTPIGEILEAELEKIDVVVEKTA